MSIEINEPTKLNKAQRIKREFVASLSPLARERLAVDIVKETHRLTKIRIRRIIPIRANGDGEVTPD